MDKPLANPLGQGAGEQVWGAQKPAAAVAGGGRRMPVVPAEQDCFNPPSSLQKSQR